jgi:hypothetical protein
VIEYLSGSVSVSPAGTKPLFVQVNVFAAGMGTANYLPLAFQGDLQGSDTYIYSQLVRMYADANTVPLVEVLINDSTASGGFSVTASGYLVSVP